MKYVKFPIWKKYLFNFLIRYKAFKAINQGKPNIRIGRLFFSPRNELRIIYSTLLKYGKGGIIRTVAPALLYWEFCNTVVKNPDLATKEEKELAERFYIKLNPIRIGEIYMEIKKLKEFAEEVGLTKVKGMDEDDLIKAIVKKIDPEEQYSKAFVKWYEDLDEAYFEEEEEEKPKGKKEKGKKKDVEEEEEPKKSKKKKEISIEDLKDKVTEAEELDELTEILDENESVFEDGDFNKKKFSKLQEQMLEYLEEKAEEEKPKKKTKKEEVEEEDEKPDNSKLVKKVNKCEDVDDLKEVVKANPKAFPDISLKGIQKFENLQKRMLIALGEIEEEEKTKKKDLDPDDPDSWDELPIGALKKKAKELGVKTKPGMSKVETIKLMNKALTGKKGKDADEDTGEMEIDQSLINKLVKNKDIDKLVEVAKQLEVKVSVLDKKSPKRLGEKLIEALSDSGSEKEEEDEKPKKKAKREEVEEEDEKPKKKVSIYSQIEDMVLKGLSNEKILKKMLPQFEEMDKSEKYAKKRISQMVMIIKEDHNMEDDD